MNKHAIEIIANKVEEMQDFTEIYLLSGTHLF